MTKARKAPLKKTTQRNQNVRIASSLFVALGVLVVLAMLLGSIFTQNPQSVVPIATSFATVIPTLAATAVP